MTEKAMEVFYKMDFVTDTKDYGLVFFNDCLILAPNDDEILTTTQYKNAPFLQNYLKRAYDKGVEETLTLKNKDITERSFKHGRLTVCRLGNGYYQAKYLRMICKVFPSCTWFQNVLDNYPWLYAIDREDNFAVRAALLPVRVNG